MNVTVDTMRTACRVAIEQLHLANEKGHTAENTAQIRGQLKAYRAILIMGKAKATPEEDAKRSVDDFLEALNCKDIELP